MSCVRKESASWSFVLEDEEIYSSLDKQLQLFALELNKNIVSECSVIVCLISL
jgi:hypothetical protein